MLLLGLLNWVSSSPAFVDGLKDSWYSHYQSIRHYSLDEVYILVLPEPGLGKDCRTARLGTTSKQGLHQRHQDNDRSHVITNYEEQNLHTP